MAHASPAPRPVSRLAVGRTPTRACGANTGVESLASTRPSDPHKGEVKGHGEDGRPKIACLSSVCDLAAARPVVLPSGNGVGLRGGNRTAGQAGTWGLIAQWRANATDPAPAPAPFHRLATRVPVCGERSGVWGGCLGRGWIFRETGGFSWLGVEKVVRFPSPLWGGVGVGVKRSNHRARCPHPETGPRPVSDLPSRGR